MKISTLGIKKLLFVIYVFLYIFQPALTGFKTVQVLTVLNIGIIIFKGLSRRSLRIGSYGAGVMKSFLPFLGYITILCIVTSMFGDADASIASYVNAILMFIYLFTGCFATMLIYRDNIDELPSFQTVLIIIGSLQLICVVLAYVSPGIRSFFNGLTIKNSSESLYVQALSYDARSYGFAENVFDGFGYLTSIIITITFLTGVRKKNSFLIILSLAMLIMPFLNSRTGLILAIIGILIILFVSLKEGNIRSLRYLILGIFACILFVYGFQYLPENTQSWFNRGFRETMLLLSGGGKTGVYNELLVNDWFFPDNALLGAGASPELLGYGNSDSGYIQFIWRYGIIGFILFLIPYVKSLILAAKLNYDYLDKLLFYILIVFFFIYLFKMYAFNNSAANYCVFCLIFYEVEKYGYSTETIS